MVQGKHDIFFIGEINFFQIVSPRIVIVKSRTHLNFDLIMGEEFSILENRMLDLVFVVSFGIDCAHFIIKIKTVFKFLYFEIKNRGGKRNKGNDLNMQFEIINV